MTTEGQPKPSPSRNITGDDEAALLLVRYKSGLTHVFLLMTIDSWLKNRPRRPTEWKLQRSVSVKGQNQPKDSGALDRSLVTDTFPNFHDRAEDGPTIAMVSDFSSLILSYGISSLVFLFTLGNMLKHPDEWQITWAWILISMYECMHLLISFGIHQGGPKYAADRALIVSLIAFPVGGFGYATIGAVQHATRG